MRDDQNQANARLIAAAPELLAALEELVRSADLSGGQIRQVHRRDIDHARAAIAKATGNT